MAFDPENLRLTKRQKECTLSKREGALLEIFLRNPGQTLPRALLLSRVWGMDNDVEEGNLDNYVYFLRRRLKAVGSGLVLKPFGVWDTALRYYNNKDSPNHALRRYHSQRFPQRVGASQYSPPGNRMGNPPKLFSLPLIPPGRDSPGTLLLSPRYHPSPV